MSTSGTHDEMEKHIYIKQYAIKCMGGQHYPMAWGNFDLRTP